MFATIFILFFIVYFYILFNGQSAFQYVVHFVNACTKIKASLPKIKKGFSKNDAKK